MSVYHSHAWCPGRPEEGDGPHGTGTTDGCELPRGAGNRTPATTALSLLSSLQCPTLHFKTVSQSPGAKEVGQADKPVSPKDLPSGVGT